MLVFSPLPAAAALNWQEINLQAVDRHIVPRYEKLATAAAALEQSAQGFCKAPGAETQKMLFADYHQTMDAWMNIQHIRFGPIDLFLRYNRMQVWPDKHNTAARQMRQALAEQNFDQLNKENFAQSSVALQGLGTLERLLFDDDTAPAAFAGDGKPNYRCALIVAIAANVAEMGRGAADEWIKGKTPYREIIRSAEQGNDYFASNEDVTSRLLNNLYTELQLVQDAKLLEPLGKDAKSAKPKLAESWRSRRSLRNVQINLQAVQDLYGVVFAPALQSAGKKSLDDDIRKSFAETIAAANAITTSVYEGAGDPALRPAWERLLQSLRVLKRQISTLPQALDIPLGFNSLDGD
jgi:predicted lipoprotein